MPGAFVTSAPALAFGVIAAFANVMGAWAVTRSARLGLRVIELLFAYAAGFMIALALVGVVPEALAKDPATAAPVILLGYLLVHLTQHTVTPHFHFGQETHRVSHAASVSGIVGLLLHTFFDGVAIASGFLVSPSLGLLFFFAIFVHKLPEGVTVSSLVLAAGETPRRAVLASSTSRDTTAAARRASPTPPPAEPPRSKTSASPRIGRSRFRVSSANRSARSSTRTTATAPSRAPQWQHLMHRR